VDTVTPTVTVTTSNADVNLAHASATVSFSFSEAPTSFTSGAIATSGGTLSGLMEVDATHYTATFTPAANTDGTGSVSVISGGWQEVNGNPGSGGSTSFTVDTVTPTVTVTTSNADVNLAHASATVSFTFSEAPTSFTSGAIATSGGTLSGLIEVDATHYTATFTPAANTDGTGSVSVISGGWQEVNGNLGSGGSTSFIVDTVTPTVTSVVANPNSGNYGPGQVVIITVTLSENVTVTGTPTLSLNDGGTASYTGGSGTNALTFSYTVASGQSTANLTVTRVNLPNGAAVQDAVSGNNANLSGADVTFGGLQIGGDNWLNAKGGNWSTASNWSNGVPTANVDALVGVGGSYTVTISSADLAHSLTVNSSGALISDNSGGSLALAGGSGVLTISSGTFQLNGGALKAGSISIGASGNLLIANGVNYTGTNALTETITNNGAIMIQNSSSVGLAGSITGAGALTVQNGSTATFGNVSGSQTFMINGNGSKVTISGTVSGSESFTINNNAQLVITGAVNSTGSFSLAKNSILELGSSDNANIAFGSGQNTLSVSAPITGALSGLTLNDTIDLADLTWVNGLMTSSFSGNTSGGTLTIGNGSQKVNLQLSGDYTHSTWSLSEDRTGGTDVVDPPADAPPEGAAEGYKQPQSSRLSPDPELDFTNAFSIMDTWLSHGDDGMIWRRIGSLPGSGSNSPTVVSENVSNVLNDWLNPGAGALTTNAGGLTDASTTLVPPTPPTASAEDLLRHITATSNRG
jgi:hypothetical protein